MAPLADGLTLFTSDHRPRYANDALTVLALPPGTRFHFRYGLVHVPADVRHAFETADVTGTRTLVAFRAPPGKPEAVVPLRLATVVSVERVADFFVVGFEVGGYPRIAFPSGCTEELNAAARQYLDEKPPSQRPMAVHRGFASLVESEEAGDRDGWLLVARALSHYPTYRETHFLRISAITATNRRPLRPAPDGAYPLRAHRLYYLRMNYYAERLLRYGSRLTVTTDGNLIRLGSTAAQLLDTKYDSVMARLDLRPVPAESHTEVTVRVRDGRPDSPETRVVIPVVIRRSPLTLAVHTGMSALAGLLIALPAVVGPAANVGLRVVCAVVGAVLLATSTVILRVGSR